MPNTSDFISEAIAKIEPAGVEEVFDIQIERTENFIANGLVSHNSRWHEDDLAGRILQASEAGDGEPWETLHMPAINELGGALWPARWPLEELAKIKQAIGARAWAAKFQGTPKQTHGNILDSSKLVMMETDALPPMAALVRRWDLAFSDAKGADYSVGVKMGRDKEGKVYILHCKITQGRWPQSKPLIIATAQQDGKAVQCAIEANGPQLGYYQDIKADPSMRNITVVADKPEGSKEMRAEVWGSRLEDGVIYCVRASWNGEMFDQMDSFPSSDHDDIVDAISGGWGLLSKSFRLMIV